MTRRRHRACSVRAGRCCFPSFVEVSRRWDRDRDPGTDYSLRGNTDNFHSGITSRWSCPAPRPKCKQDDNNQQSSVRIRMATGGKLNRLRKALKRFSRGGSSSEGDWDTGNNAPKQGQIENNVSVECGPAAEEGEQIQPRDSDVRDTDQDPKAGTSEATVCQPRDSDVRDTDQDPKAGTSEATVCQPRDSDVRDTEQDPGTSTSEATVCQPRDSDVRDTEQDPGTSTSEATVCQSRDAAQDPGTSTSEATVCQPRDSDVRDTEQDPGTSTSEATVCQSRDAAQDPGTGTTRSDTARRI
ncbi:uncharacterized protein [Mobula birostris]|uniref:uncharacterized protein n=1 Tax=Mobula birostris TaxID=1983395 RepID=UPI003B28D1A9